jgi:Domain of unknown function (DUF4265)
MNVREKDSLVVEVTFPIEKDSEGFPKSRDFEALLCTPLDPESSKCQVASVPFFLSNVAYGDTISTTTDRLGNLQFGSVLKRGGYSVYRVLVHDQYEGDAPISKFLDLDALVERNGNLIAIAVPPTKGADAVVDLILEGKRKGIWGAQDGYIHDQT